MAYQKKQQATIITPEELREHPRKLPKSWTQAAGLLRHKRIDPVAYQRRIRQEWEDRMKKLEREWQQLNRYTKIVK